MMIYSQGGITALHLAAHFGQMDTVMLLLEKGADIDIGDDVSQNIDIHVLHAVGRKGKRSILLNCIIMYCITFERD